METGLSGRHEVNCGVPYPPLSPPPPPPPPPDVPPAPGMLGSCRYPAQVISNTDVSQTQMGILFFRKKLSPGGGGSKNYVLFDSTFVQDIIQKPATHCL